ncbi:MAG: Holliday junction DNA helicase [Candidatus Micrarchaeota archaeon]|nr:MAG: Holliday junction DNA helicase [Candidatus Micrarchaeota archaeon]
MSHYRKGADRERELLNLFIDNGFVAIRAAGSGVNSLSPDLIVFKNKIGAIIECKAVSKKILYIRKEQIETLKRWSSESSIRSYLAWRINRVGWRFIEIKDLKELNDSFAISKDHMIEKGLDVESFIGIFK